MTELQHLQKVILDITKDIDKLCRDNDIDYHLIAGSAIGAIRHHGFIPWDDDLDIEMTPENYYKFLDVCHKQLDKNKYYLQEGLKDWPLDFSKIKLRGTKMVEPELYVNESGEEGIFVDIFRIDSAAPTSLGRRWQYICAKYRMCYLMSLRTYKSASLSKRLLIALSFPQRIGFIRKFFKNEVEKYNGRKTGWYGLLFGKTRYKTCFVRSEVVETSIRVPFEDTELPVPKLYDEYLTHLFGNYMQLPPVGQRVGGHLIFVDFGKY